MRVYRGIKQATPEWFQLRSGKPTASCFDRIITPARGEPSKASTGYIFELFAERIMGCSPENVEAYTSRAMQHGVDTEPVARDAYAVLRDADVEEVAFCETDDGFAGCSPDGLVGDDGGLELKCPQLHTHLRYLAEPAKLVEDYRCQVHGTLWVTGRAWWDIASYAPWGGVPMVVQRVEPDEFTEKLAEAMADFKDRYEAAWAQIEPHLTEWTVIDEDHPF